MSSGPFLERNAASVMSGIQQQRCADNGQECGSAMVPILPERTQPQEIQKREGQKISGPHGEPPPTLTVRDKGCEVPVQNREVKVPAEHSEASCKVDR